MRGEILSYDSVSGEGLISGDDLLRYRFSRLDVGGAQEPAPGLRVDFVPLDDRAGQIDEMARVLREDSWQYGRRPLRVFEHREIAPLEAEHRRHRHIITAIEHLHDLGDVVPEHRIDSDGLFDSSLEDRDQD